jgi:hypothetical protein
MQAGGVFLEVNELRKLLVWQAEQTCHHVRLRWIEAICYQAWVCHMMCQEALTREVEMLAKVIRARFQLKKARGSAKGSPREVKHFKWR